MHSDIKSCKQSHTRRAGGMKSCHRRMPHAAPECKAGTCQNGTAPCIGGSRTLAGVRTPAHRLSGCWLEAPKTGMHVACQSGGRSSRHAFRCAKREHTSWHMGWSPSQQRRRHACLPQVRIAAHLRWHRRLSQQGTSFSKDPHAQDLACMPAKPAVIHAYCRGNKQMCADICFFFVGTRAN